MFVSLVFFRPIFSDASKVKASNCCGGFATTQKTTSRFLYPWERNISELNLKFCPWLLKSHFFQQLLCFWLVLNPPPCCSFARICSSRSALTRPNSVPTPTGPTSQVVLPSPTFPKRQVRLEARRPEQRHEDTGDQKSKIPKKKRSEARTLSLRILAF